MSSKRLEERNEKVIRGLMKLPPNRRCINCNSLGPQYVCTNFWTFVCTACSGIHREFTHRVKSVSMANFTTQEVEALQNGGNQHARDIFLKEWDMHTMRFPDNSYPDKIREFIKKVYVDKKYAGGISSEKPPRDPQPCAMQDLKDHEERRASSYHSYSQSPPYDHQYEDRRYGKPKSLLTRKPGSGHGCYDGNRCNILYSPGHGKEHMKEDRFANEFTGSSVSDLSSSSASDPFRSGCQSPNGYSSSSSRQRSTSSGSFGSFDGNTAYPKSTISGAFSDMVFEPEHTSISQPPKNFAISSLETSNPASASHNLFGAQYLQHQITKTSAVDLFADFSNPPSCTAPTEDKRPALPFSESQQWASFDTAHQVREPVPEADKSFSSGFPACVNDSTESAAIFLSKVDYSDQFLVQNSTTRGELVSSSDQRSAVINESHKSMDSSCPQVWNALNDLFVSGSEALSMISSRGLEVLVAKPAISVDHCTNVVVSKEAEDGLQVPIQVDDSYMLGLQFSSPFELLPSAALPCEVSTTQVCQSANPFDVSYDLDPGAGKMFLDMSSLQAAVPNPQLPSTSVDGFSDPWFHKSSTPAFMPAPQGFSYAGGQIRSSPFPNPPSQGSVASFRGNPFA